MSAQIEIAQASKVFGTGAGAVPALDGITATVPEGQFLCLLGPSGCGKSTLLNAIAGFTPLSAGRITMGGRPVTEPGPDRGGRLGHADGGRWPCSPSVRGDPACSARATWVALGRVLTT